MKQRLFWFGVIVSVLLVIQSPIGAYALDGNNWLPTRSLPTEYSAILYNQRIPAIVLQFDDGNITHYTVGWPILQAHGLVGSFGIVTGQTDVASWSMTGTQIRDLWNHGCALQDHTRNHNAAEWGSAAYASQWGPDILFSQNVFKTHVFADLVKFDPTRVMWVTAWNEPGGNGEGWTPELEDTLIHYGYRYTAGAVALTNDEWMNFHPGLLDNPFRLGRCVFSWGYNAPATALQAAGIDPNTDRGKRLLELVPYAYLDVRGLSMATESGQQALGMFMSPDDPVTKKQAIAYSSLSGDDSVLLHEIMAAWTWQAEVAAMERSIVNGIAARVIPDPVFHQLDNPDVVNGLTALCDWIVAEGLVALNMDQAFAYAQSQHWYDQGTNIAPPFNQDRNGDGLADAWGKPWAPVDLNGFTSNGAEVTMYGLLQGSLVVTCTLEEATQPAGVPDDFTIEYTTSHIDQGHTYSTHFLQRLRQMPGNQQLTYSDTLTIDGRDDRLRVYWYGMSKNNFQIVNFSAVPIAGPTGVTGRTPRAGLAVMVAPNPTGGQTTINFQLGEQTATSVAIYDVHGRLVERLINNQPLSGPVSLSWQNDNVASGIYFARVTAGSAVTTKKITLIR